MIKGAIKGFLLKLKINPYKIPQMNTNMSARKVPNRLRNYLYICYNIYQENKMFLVSHLPNLSLTKEVVAVNLTAEEVANLSETIIALDLYVLHHLA